MLNKHLLDKVSNTLTFIVWLIIFLPLSANALGVKDIQVLSALNQPLKAKVGLISIKGLDINDIKVRLASPRVFKNAGIARPYFLTRLKFEPMVADDGNAYIQITSRDAVREPYLDFMLEVSWRGGSFIKEFTILLDPVVLRNQSSGPDSGAAKMSSVNTPLIRKQIYGPVQEAETLWIIAQKTRPDTSIPIKQMIMAIHQENPEAFAHGNINLLKQGATLRIPDQRSIMAITYGAATKLYTEQEQEWKGSKSITDDSEVSSDTESVSHAETAATLVSKPDTAPAAALAETTSAQQPAEEPQIQTISITEAKDEHQEKLEIVATPEDQMDEVTPAQGAKVYPKDEIEELRGSIADNTDDVSALESINRDLVRLRSALKSKIALIKQELEKTDQAIAIVSGKLEITDTETVTDIQNKDEANDGDATASAPSSLEPTALQKNTVDTKQDTDLTVTETAITLEDSVKSKQPQGINISTDQLASERINRLETEIAGLKSQSETVQTQKYLIIILTLAFLAALTFIVFSNRENLLKIRINGNPLNLIMERLNKHIKSFNLDSTADVFQSEIEDKIKPAHPQQHSEMPFDEPDNSREQELSFTEPPTTLTNHDQEQHTTESAADSTGDLPTQNTVMFESARSEDDHDIDYTLTSVDVYIAYRRFSEAESILRNAIEKHPGLPELKAKLLEIYAFKKDVKAFTRHLETYKEELSIQAPKLWQEALQEGVQLIPSHPYIQAYTKGMSAANSDEKTILGT